MDLGISIAIAGIAIPAGAVCITAIKAKAVGQNGNGNGKTPLCQVHQTVETRLGDIWDAITVVQEDIKELLKRGGK
jgi:hypothetical protein